MHMKLILAGLFILVLGGHVSNAAENMGIQMRCHTEGTPHGYTVIIRPVGEDLEGMIVLSGSLSSSSFIGKVELKLSEQNKRCALDILWSGDSAQALKGTRVSFQADRKINHIEELVIKGKDMLGKADTPHPIECVPNKAFLERYRQVCSAASNAAAENKPAPLKNSQSYPHGETSTAR